MRENVVVMPGDGNCLFHSLAHFLRGENHVSVRQKVCDWMASGEAHGTPLSHVATPAYIRRMRRAGVWGGEPECFAASQCFGLDITVLTDRVGTYLLRYGEGDGRGVLLSYDGTHYNAVERSYRGRVSPPRARARAGRRSRKRRPSPKKWSFRSFMTRKGSRYRLSPSSRS